MNKEWKNMFIFLGIVITLVILSFILKIGIDNDQNSNLNQEHLYEYNYKQETPITYSFNVIEEEYTGKKTICGDFKKDKVRLAFEKIENATENTLIFKEVEEESDIEIWCERKKVTDFDGITYTMDLGLATVGILGEKIEGNITFYGGGEKDNLYYCTDTELHEIFHVIGFDHNDYPSSLMNPMNDAYFCTIGIDNYIINDIIYYYG